MEVIMALRAEATSWRQLDPNGSRGPTRSAEATKAAKGCGGAARDRRWRQWGEKCRNLRRSDAVLHRVWRRVLRVVPGGCDGAQSARAAAPLEPSCTRRRRAS